MIARGAADQAAKGRQIDWSLCRQAAGASVPPCTGYLNVIASYVELYGGGKDTPMIGFFG